MAVVDLVHLYFCLMFGKVELLHERVVLVYVPGGLDLDIKVIHILAVGDGEALDFFNPRQQGATEYQAGQLPWLLEEGHQLGLEGH